MSAGRRPSFPQKERVDKRLVITGLAKTREHAQALILSGAVLVDGRKIEKAGTWVAKDCCIGLVESALPYHGLEYVSRGGLKIEKALDAFRLDVTGKIVVDVGASTGGFTDCLLKRGAKRVYAVDVGYGQLAWRLRQDSRVVNLERTHILHLSRRLIPDTMDLVTIDVSFISLTRVLSKVLEFLKPSGMILALVKPQFEVGKGEVGKGGIVRDPAKRSQAVKRILNFAEGLFLKSSWVFECPVPGRDGNVEFFVLLERTEVGVHDANPM